MIYDSEVIKSTLLNTKNGVFSDVFFALKKDKQIDKEHWHQKLKTELLDKSMTYSVFVLYNGNNYIIELLVNYEYYDPKL